MRYMELKVVEEIDVKKMKQTTVKLLAMTAFQLSSGWQLLQILFSIFAI